VHAANALDREVNGAEEDRNANRLDTDYLDRIGLAHRIPAWREAAIELSQTGGEDR